MKLKRIALAANLSGIFDSFSKKFKKKHRLFIIELLEDLIESGVITILVYFLALLFFYIWIATGKINDPSSNVRSNFCSHLNNSLESMPRLVSFVNRILNQTNHKYFVCYRTLFDQLKLKPQYHDKNTVDICLYNQQLNPLGLEANLFGSMISQNFENELKNFQIDNKNFNFTYDHILGMYHLKLAESSLFIYVFVYMPETKYEFESLRRSGLLYIQFSYLNKLLLTPTEPTASQATTGSSFRMPGLIQLYMIDDAMFKIKIMNDYIFLPDDPYSLLMHMFPNHWYKTDKFCSL